MQEGELLLGVVALERGVDRIGGMRDQDRQRRLGHQQIATAVQLGRDGHVRILRPSATVLVSDHRSSYSSAAVEQDTT